MRRRLKLAILVIICVLNGNSGMANEKSVVYLECISPEGKSRFGSGVITSTDGHVLTLKHVARDGFECTGSIGSPANPRFRLERDSMSLRTEGIVLQFEASAGPFSELRFYCPINGGMKEQQVLAWGFHSNSTTEHSSTDGIISTGNPDEKGMVETSAITASGKSGGPVFWAGSNTLVGLIAGADFDSLGVPTSYKILSMNVLSQLTRLEVSSRCPRIKVADEGSDTSLFENDFLRVEKTGANISKDGREVTIISRIHNTTSEPLKILYVNRMAPYTMWSATENGNAFTSLSVQPIENSFASPDDASKYISIQPNQSLPVIWTLSRPWYTPLVASHLSIVEKFYRHTDRGPEKFQISMPMIQFRDLGSQNPQAIKEDITPFKNDSISVKPLALWKLNGNKELILSAQMLNLTDKRLHLTLYGNHNPNAPYISTDIGDQIRVQKYGLIKNGAPSIDQSELSWLDPGDAITLVWWGQANQPINGQLLNLSDRIYLYENGSVEPLEIQLDGLPF